MTKASAGPSAEPVVWAGLITSLLLGAIQFAVGHGILTGDQAASLSPQVAILANAAVTALPFLLSFIPRSAVTPTGGASPLPSPAVVTVTSTNSGNATGTIVTSPTFTVPLQGGAPVLTVDSTSPFAAGTTGTIPAGTRRWSLDGTELGPIGPSTLDLVSLDLLSGAIHGHFLKTGTSPEVYVEASAVTIAGGVVPAPTSASTPAAGTPPRVSFAPIVPVDLTARSTNTEQYIQQFYALEADPTLVATLPGVWPSEITGSPTRTYRIAEMTAALVGAGAHWVADPLLSCGQVRYADQQAVALEPSMRFNPIYLAALGRAAAAVNTARLPDSAPLPWAKSSTPYQLISVGSYGVTPVSGPYGA